MRKNFNLKGISGLTSHLSFQGLPIELMHPLIIISDIVDDWREGRRGGLLLRSFRGICLVILSFLEASIFC